MVSKKKGESDDEFRIRRAKYQRDYRKNKPPKPLTEDQKKRAHTLRKERVSENPEKYRQLRSDSYKRNLKREQEYGAEYREVNKETLRSRELKRKYGISIEDYELMFKSQKGLCGICYLPSGDRNFDIDHCHSTGKVRGLLCRSCNVMIGHSKDDPILLLGAVDYLQRNS